MYKFTNSKTKLILTLLVASITLCFAMILSVQAISRGYTSDDIGLQAGMVVKLSHTGTPEAPKIERATNDEPDRVIGVVVTVNESAVIIGSSIHSVYVETIGEVAAYVSDVNGKINKGDLLTFSPFDGILAKHNESARNVFGIALEDFPDQPSETHTIRTYEGDKTVGIAKIKINLDQKAIQGAQQGHTPVLARYGESVVGKQVSSIRVAIAITIFITILIAEGAILYGAITSAVSSIGRNPLSRQYIKHELMKVIVVVLFVFLFGIGSIYIVLWV